MLGRSGTGAPAMSIIPLHLQRRLEQRWAARFGSLANPARTNAEPSRAAFARAAEAQRREGGRCGAWCSRTEKGQTGHREKMFPPTGGGLTSAAAALTMKAID